MRSLCTIIAVTALPATYLLLEGMRPAPSTTANQREYRQEVVHAEKSDRLETIKEILSEKLVRLEKYYRPADNSSKYRSYLAYYTYSEVPPDKRPADIALDSLKDIPVGTPIEEIKRASNAFGLDLSFMKAVAKIESDLTLSSAPDRILVFSNSAITSLRSMGLETFLMLGTTLLPLLTSSLLRPYCSN